MYGSVIGPASLAGCSGAEPSGSSGSGAIFRTVESTSLSGTGGGVCAAGAWASNIAGRTPSEKPASVAPDTRIAFRRVIVMDGSLLAIDLVARTMASSHGG